MMAVNSVRRRPPTLKKLDHQTSHIEKVAHYDETLQFSRKVLSGGSALTKNGVLNAVVGSEDFYKLTGKIWKAPLDEPKYERDDLESAAGKKEQRDLYLDEKARFDQQEAGIALVFEFLTEPFADNKTLMAKLVPPGDKRTPDAMDIKEVAANYLGIICIPKTGEMTSVLKQLEAMTYTNKPSEFDDYTMKIVEKVAYLTRFEHKFADESLVAALARGFGGTAGPFKDGVKALYSRPPKEQTVANLIEDIKKDNELRRVTTSAEMGFAAAVTAEAAADRSSDETAARLAEAATLLGFPTVAAAAAAAAKQQQAPQAPLHHRARGKGKGADAEGGGVDLFAPLPVMLYCWSCGPNKDHKGDKCPDPEQGHIAQATREKPQGGRRIPTPVGRRAKYPHPT